MEALQKAIDSRASKAELKDVLARCAEARKKKQAELEKAQADSRQVLPCIKKAHAAHGILMTRLQPPKSHLRQRVQAMTCPHLGLVLSVIQVPNRQRLVPMSGFAVW